MLLTLLCWVFVRLNSTYGQGRSNARHPSRIQSPKCVHGKEGEAQTAKNRNGYAGWNVGKDLDHPGNYPEAKNRRKAEIHFDDSRSRRHRFLQVLAIGELPSQRKRIDAWGTWVWRALNASIEP